VIFSLFEAKDYRCNLKTGLGRFTEQIDQLQTMQWKYVYEMPIVEQLNKEIEEHDHAIDLIHAAICHSDAKSS